MWHLLTAKLKELNEEEKLKIRNTKFLGKRYSCMFKNIYIYYCIVQSLQTYRNIISFIKKKKFYFYFS